MKLVQILGILTLTSLLSGTLSAQEYYRYKDENGVTRMDISIPAQYVDQGYEVLDAQGRVIERVPPKAPETASESDSGQQADDAILLSSYSSVEEIAAHRDRRIAGVDRQIDIIMSDRRILTEELDKEIRAASGYRADDREVPGEISARIDELDGMVESLDQQLIRRAEEKEQINQEFSSKIERFRAIKPAEE